jgi:hypothetical protein
MHKKYKKILKKYFHFNIKQISLTKKNSKENKDGFPVWANYGLKSSLNIIKAVLVRIQYGKIRIHTVW